ncbi:hypothetical protein BDN71DRAFT_1431439 [Pleurotus eryngii]|uniref:Uncharacterized protein n=1 Tax=Pleurotus eryngii TaxID=5323 RepID=A0A9P5ZY44_PLEER|nr:hypothetical protein BDN71DRAFT_1431439 [Pleurotus eryngii]
MCTNNFKPHIPQENRCVSVRSDAYRLPSLPPLPPALPPFLPHHSHFIPFKTCRSAGSPYMSCKRSGGLMPKATSMFVQSSSSSILTGGPNGRLARQLRPVHICVPAEGDRVSGLGIGHWALATPADDGTTQSSFTDMIAQTLGIMTALRLWQPTERHHNSFVRSHGPQMYVRFTTQLPSWISGDNILQLFENLPGLQFLDYDEQPAATNTTVGTAMRLRRLAFTGCAEIMMRSLPIGWKLHLTLSIRSNGPGTVKRDDKVAILNTSLLHNNYAIRNIASWSLVSENVQCTCTNIAGHVWAGSRICHPLFVTPNICLAFGQRQKWRGKLAAICQQHYV